ncbi:MAG: DUF3857 domain-containing protein [Flavobacteriaceae bacterium]
MSKLFALLTVFISITVSAQKKYSVKSIPKELVENANAVIRNDETVITLDNFNSMTKKYHEVITVFNKNGLNIIKPVAYYDNSSSIKNVKVIIYDELGNEIEEYKKRDFSDISASGGNLYSDNRKLVLDFTPGFYPFTFEFISEVKTSSTAFVPRWYPSPYYRVSTENSSYKLINERQIPLTAVKYNLEEFNVDIIEKSTLIEYRVSNIKAVDREYLSPDYTEFNPVVKIALKKFQLENSPAYVSNWKEFGYWQNNKLLNNRNNLPEQTKLKIESLVADVDDPKEKAKLIYKFMQDKTRYISVQIGIGGWQPSSAKEVDKLSYGDCKGLTNYTKALLESQGIESYYTIVDSKPYGRDIDEDFVALQGNHVILTIPFEDEQVFLECTSQQLPFNYLGTHTDNRKVLMITPEGGVFTKTHEYKTEDNIRSLIATANIDDTFVISGDLTETSIGLQYNLKYDLSTYTNEEKKTYYNYIWSHLNKTSFSDIEFNNDKNDVVFTEKLKYSTGNYISKAGERVLLNPNIFNRYSKLISSNKERTLDFIIKRGSTFKDEISISLPENYKIESLFKPIAIETPYGKYTATITEQEQGKLLYKRELILNSGRYNKDQYNDYVKFIKSVVRKDKSKIVLLKNEN